MARKLLLLIILLAAVSSVCLFAQDGNLSMKIAVIGPGDELYFWWGHIALIVEDSFTGASFFYDYGLFSFDNENFFYNFAFGRLIYSCGASLTSGNLERYVDDNREIVIYTLDLPYEKMVEVKIFADYNLLPGRRDYQYHHFRDNCSTRIRDIIDLMTDGQFYEQYGKVPGRYTLRQHVRRHTWFCPPADWALNFWMGQVIDTPISIWDEMFLPAEVGRRIGDFYYTDAGGNRRKLVSSVETVYKAQKRPAILDVPRRQWPRQLFFSIGLSVVFGFFFFLKAKQYRAGRILAGAGICLSGFIFGFTSLLLYFLNLFTNHDYTFQNYNMLFGTPLLLALVPLGICYALTKKPEKLAACDALSRLVWLVTAIGIFISMAIRLLPQFYQQNLTDQMLMLPIALTFALQPAGLREVLNKFLPVKIFKRKKHENT